MVDYAEQKEYWEGMGKRRHPSHPVIEAFAGPKLRWIRDHTEPPTDGPHTMVEIGAGNGYFSYGFDRAFELTATDFSETMLEMNPLPSNQKVQADASNLPFGDDSFDLAFCGNLLHHLEAPEVAVREMGRVARKHVVLLEPNALNPLMFAFGVVKREERGTLKFTPPYLKGLGKRAGLRLRAFSTQGMVLPNKTPEKLLPVFKAIDRPNPMGFYHVAIFDV